MRCGHMRPMCIHTPSSGRSRLSSSPPVLGRPGTRAGLCAKDARPSCSSSLTGGEHYLRLRGACGAFLCGSCGVSPRGETRAPVRSRYRLYRYVFELITQRYGGGPPKRHSAKEGRAILRTMSLGRLTRGVDLLICYVDLRYGPSFEELADLGQRPDRREVASVGPI